VPRSILWPERTAKTSIAVRLGRALHLVMTGLALAAMVGALAAAITYGFSGDLPDVLLFSLIMIAVAGTGRVAKYVLAGE